MRAQCCICSDLFENRPTVNIAAVPCGHTFHEECLMRWMESSSTCPSCRSSVKRNQIIRRLFFDIQEDTRDEHVDVNRLYNQISSLNAQINEKEKLRHELVESRDFYATRVMSAESDRDEYRCRLLEEQNAREVMQRDLRVLRVENAAYIEEMKEFRKTQRRLQELQSVETLLKGCDSEIQDVVSQYAEGGESSIKHLASLLTVVKREYNQVLADKRALREQMSKMKRSVGNYHSELHHSKREVRELKSDLEKTQEALSQIEKENNENRRKIVHLRNALRHSKTEGSQSFHRALNEDSPNVAYTPPTFKDKPPDMNHDEDNENQIICMTPDLFEESPRTHRRHLKRKCLEELDGPKLKFANIPTAEERLQASRRIKAEKLEDDPPGIPHALLSILQKKLTGKSNSRAHVPSVITRGYDGFGGSETCVHTRDQSSASLKQEPKKDTVSGKTSSKPLPKRLAKQPQISSFVQRPCHAMFPSSSKFIQSPCHTALPSSSSSSSLSSVEEVGDSGTWKLKFKLKAAPVEKPKKKKIYGVKELPPYTTSKSSSTLSLKDAPKLSPEVDFIDLT
ncbi:hypothetical protein BsWGS_26283 [Bradybaena similaris]